MEADDEEGTEGGEGKKRPGGGRSVSCFDGQGCGVHEGREGGRRWREASEGRGTDGESRKEEEGAEWKDEMEWESPGGVGLVMMGGLDDMVCGASMWGCVGWMYGALAGSMWGYGDDRSGRWWAQWCRHYPG